MTKERPGGYEGQERRPDEGPFFRAARFQKEGAARRAYFATQETIYQAECDLSTYRFLLNGIWHVAVTGNEPPEELAERLGRNMRHGYQVELPEDIRRDLSERGRQQRKHGLWSEGHYPIPHRRDTT
ncbi:MAG: hypothetical protein JOZ41_05035 [Chloroflexi bacterium]|nr:hypothetical protein [Chloroflexota bacterium]